MTKYIMSSGTSVIGEVLEQKEFTAVKITDDASKAIQFETIGEAMSKADRVNKILGAAVYRAVSIEI